jgi:hypothetical protein
MMWLPLLLALGAPPQCYVHGALPDPSCTPGATLHLSLDSICSTSTKDRRHVTESVRKRVFEEYGVPVSRSSEFEVDHLISLELGGGNDIKNLWPELYEPRPGARDKDRLENALHRQVCAGRMTLDYAQYVIATDWVAEYRKEFGP